MNKKGKSYFEWFLEGFASPILPGVIYCNPNC